LIIQEAIPVDAELINWEELVAKSQQQPEVMLDKITAIVDELDDVYIRDLLKNILFDGDIRPRLKIWQAGKSIHHAYESGLLEHILSCAQLAVTLSGHYAVNRNYVVAGAILHDLCKIYELSRGPLVAYTDEGKLVGHLVRGIELVEHFCSKIKNFPHDCKMHLKHILLSHHGSFEYGSPKLPATLEAMLVHQIDVMDSKLNSFKTIMDQDKTNGNWSGYIKHLDRIIYKEPLPFYSEYEYEKKIDKGKGHQGPGELKHNMGELLKDFNSRDEK